MFKTTAIVIFLAALQGGTAALASDGRAVYAVAPAPAWVEPVALDLNSQPPSKGAKGAADLLLEDTQVQVYPKGREIYSRVATRTLTAAGLAEAGQINIYVDPTFQSLALHHVQIIRSGHSLDQLGHAKITAVPVETDLDRRIYNGVYTVNILLEDLRIGDVVDYAFTRRSLDPLWPDHFGMAVRVGSDESLRLKRLRIVHPFARDLHYREYGTEVRPRESVSNGQRELRFEWRDLPAVVADSSQPSWYSAWPWLEVSDWADWGDVARNAAGLYAPRERDRESLKSLIASIGEGDATAEERVQRALQFVQEQIRYTSIAIGVGGQRPSPPQTVLARRFGDCKDKSLLLVSILRGIGIQAVPALVSSTHGHILPGRLPSMSLFDHVITRVSLPSGTFWLDPTDSKQLLPLARLDPADFEFALPLSPSAHGLESIPRPDTHVLRREVEASIDASHGLEAPASLDIVTRYLGPDADSMRSSLEATSAAETQKRYLNYYAEYYDGIHSVAPPSIDESPRHDAIVVSELYRLDSGFTKDPNGLLHLSLTPDEISPYSEPLAGTVRNSPLSIPFPVNVVQSFRVNLPEEWQIKHEVVSVDNPAFRYSSEVRMEEHQLRVRYSYVALQDHVPLAELARYLSDRARMNKDLGYQLTKNPAAASLSNYAIAPLPFLVLLAALAGGGVLAVRVYRWDPPPRESLERNAPGGIGGWLLLLALSVVVLPLVTLWLLGVYSLYVRSDVWLGITGVASTEARVWVRWGLLVCFGATGAFVPITVTAALLFFKKRTSAPMVFIATMFGSLVVGTLAQGVLIYSGLDDETPRGKFWAQTVRDGIVTLAWCAYLLKSKRVRATFIERRRIVAAAPADASSAVPSLPPGERGP